MLDWIHCQGHITTLHSQTTCSPGNWKISRGDLDAQATSCKWWYIGYWSHEENIWSLERDNDFVVRLQFWSSDQLSSRPFLAVSGKPDAVRPQECNPAQGSDQLLPRPYPHQVADVFQHQVVPGVDDPPAAHLERQVHGVVALITEVLAQSLVPCCFTKFTFFYQK